MQFIKVNLSGQKIANLVAVSGTLFDSREYIYHVVCDEKIDVHGTIFGAYHKHTPRKRRRGRGSEGERRRRGREKERRKQNQNCFSNSHFCQLPFPHMFGILGSL